MVIAKIFVDGVSARIIELEKVPQGIIGATIEVTYSEEWSQLTKTAVFSGSATKDVLGVGNIITIPAEVVAKPGPRLRVGFYGVAGEALTIPTLWADLGNIQAATDPSGDTSTDPELPVWAQLQKEVEELKKNGGAEGPQGEPGPQGEKGEDGKTPVKGTDYWTQKDKQEIVDEFGAVSYKEQTLTEEQKAQARENIGAVSKEEAEQIITPEDTPGALSAKQINALDELFKATSYIKDVSAEYAAFCDAFGLVSPDVGNYDPAFIMWHYTEKVNGSVLGVSREVTTARIILCSAKAHERRLLIHDGSSWAVSDYSPFKIPNNAVYAQFVLPSDMRYGAMICENKPDDDVRVVVTNDIGWKTGDGMVDVSAYTNGNYYICANLSNTKSTALAEDFDTSVIGFYFTDADGNRIP